MPRAPKICGQPGCPEQATERGRCPEHQREAWAGSDRRATLPKHWPKLRLQVLRRDRWLCQLRDPGCTIRATEVDHGDGGRDDHRPENLRAVCSTCHTTRTLAQAAQARQRHA